MEIALGCGDAIDCIKDWQLSKGDQIGLWRVLERLNVYKLVRIIRPIILELRERVRRSNRKFTFHYLHPHPSYHAQSIQDRDLNLPSKQSESDLSFLGIISDYLCLSSFPATIYAI
jgi:hypothetical protein